MQIFFIEEEIRDGKSEIGKEAPGKIFQLISDFQPLISIPN